MMQESHSTSQRALLAAESAALVAAALGYVPTCHRTRTHESGCRLREKVPCCYRGGIASPCAGPKAEGRFRGPTTHRGRSKRQWARVIPPRSHTV
eukprot:scaffold5498_cov75-Phaeocystis_antarctica.AAC.5